ncbi:MAG: hypothetical protein LKI94_02005 [Sporolactobacillus sp.]|nr:hypothetical protein [Sporolactobacillus sp.]
MAMAKLDAVFHIAIHDSIRRFDAETVFCVNPSKQVIPLAEKAATILSLAVRNSLRKLGKFIIDLKKLLIDYVKRYNESSGFPVD